MFSSHFLRYHFRSHTSSSNQASIVRETQSNGLSPMLSIRSCNFWASEHWISEATVKFFCSRCFKISFKPQVRGTKRLLPISPAYFGAACALFERKETLFALLCRVQFSMMFNKKKFFVIGEKFSCTSFSETKSGKRATRFEPVPSRELYLELGRSIERHRQEVRSTSCELVLQFL